MDNGCVSKIGHEVLNDRGLPIWLTNYSISQLDRMKHPNAGPALVRVRDSGYLQIQGWVRGMLELFRTGDCRPPQGVRAFPYDGAVGSNMAGHVGRLYAELGSDMSGLNTPRCTCRQCMSNIDLDDTRLSKFRGGQIVRDVKAKRRRS